MPQQTVNGTTLEVLDTAGAGPPVCFSHGLLWDHRMYAPQIEALRDRYRCIAWDHRGQGRSAVPDAPAVAIETVTADAIALIEALQIAPVHFVGLSMGGFVGMRIAARRPELIRSLVLLDTAPDPEPRAHLPRYKALSWAVRLLGVRSFLAERVLRIMCSASWLADPAHADTRQLLKERLMGLDRSIVRAVAGVLEREGVEAEIGDIRCPTLVARGVEDAAISRERSRLLADGIAGARWVEFDAAGHTSTLEQPEAVTAAIAAFLEETAAAGA